LNTLNCDNYNIIFNKKVTFKNLIEIFESININN
jgi:hypothetical protein